MRVDFFDFDLPKELIAIEPARPRDAAKLLHVGHDKLKDYGVLDLPQLLQPGDLLVINDTKVIPARLLGNKRGSGGKVEVTLTKERGPCLWECFARPAKRCRPGDFIDFSSELTAEIISRDGPTLTLNFNVEADAFFPLLEKVGSMPLPPYIKRSDEKPTNDSEDYQTIFAAKPGAVAAPTASLHFTDRLLKKLSERGVKTDKVTLHVGAGTFLPVVTDDTADHLMHSEFCVMPRETAASIEETHRSGGKVVAAGTTSLRTMESFAREDGTVEHGQKNTSIFITPGYKFRAVDRLLTNFHLPRSTLFMLVSAFCGLDTMQAAYKHAMTNDYRFYSYGDASLLERKDF